jgi:DNA (cytosine-5)-methyltransferase 1
MSSRPEFTLLREQAGLDLRQAASLIEVSERMVYRYENGTCSPSKLAMRALKQAAEMRTAAQDGDFTFIDLFSGIGGLRRGFEKIGGHCVFSCEWDKYSRDTYSRNYPVSHDFGVDVRDYSREPELVPKHDVLLAGFPCQPFSLAGVSKKNALGRPHGFLCDTQGTLFFDLAQIIAHRRPAAFVLENVKNLESHDGGNRHSLTYNNTN